MERACWVIDGDCLFASLLSLPEVVALEAVFLVSNPLKVNLVSSVRHEDRGGDDALAGSDLGNDVVVTVHNVPVGAQSRRVEGFGDGEFSTCAIECRERSR